MSAAVLPLLVSAFVMSTSALVSGAEPEWSQLPPVPDQEGFAGSFAGVSGGALIVAGGANIVGEKWGETFTKKWYESVFVLEQSDGARWAVLSVGEGRAPLHGKEGDIIDGRYRILKIGNESIDMAYLDGRGKQTIRLTGQ